MAFYELNKAERIRLVEQINHELKESTSKAEQVIWANYFCDEDTYIRKSAYLAVGKLYKTQPELKSAILVNLNSLFISDEAKVRQTVINAAGEIGMFDFSPVEHLMEQGLFDKDPSVRNAVIGSIKKMGKKNPSPTLAFAYRYLHHENKEIRREICHGIELRGRTHPKDILSMLRELEHDKTARVRNTLVHVLGQISYKKGCLATVVNDLKNWKNTDIVQKAIKEILDVHERYKNFAVLTQAQAKEYIQNHF